METAKAEQEAPTLSLGLGIDNAVKENPLRVKFMASKRAPIWQDITMTADNLVAALIPQRNVLTPRAFWLSAFLGTGMSVILYALDQFPGRKPRSVDTIEQVVSHVI